MKIKVKLQNSRECEGCPYLDKGYCCYYSQMINISNSTGYEVINQRLRKCIDENGE